MLKGANMREIKEGALAQLVEYLHGMQGVTGSNPVCSMYSDKLFVVSLCHWNHNFSASESLYFQFTAENIYFQKLLSVMSKNFWIFKISQLLAQSTSRISKSVLNLFVS